MSHHTLTALLHYHVKHKLLKITKITTIYMQKSSSETIFINFHTKIKLCLMLHTFLMFVNKSR